MISITRKQISSLAWIMSGGRLGAAGEVGNRAGTAAYLNNLDKIAKAFEYPGQAQMMQDLGEMEAKQERERRTGFTTIFSSKLKDWRLEADMNRPRLASQAMLKATVPFKVIAEKHAALHIVIGPAETDLNDPTAAAIRVEREGQATKVVINDGISAEPMVIFIEDGKPAGLERKGRATA